MKKLKFANSLVQLVLDGSKTSTWRLFDDKDLRLGDRLLFVNSDTGEEFAVVEITGVNEKPLGEMGAEDFNGHETFLSREEMLSTYQSYYSNKVGWETIVKMISFEVKDNRPAS